MTQHLALPQRIERAARAKRLAGKRRRLMRLVKIERHHRTEELART